ncbi:MAG: hypothetical protein ACPG05_05815, partial [Bdellovibrionales bacterium]
MSDSSNESSNPFAFLEPKLTAWKLVGKTANDNAKSSPSRERFLLKAIRIAHNVGHYNQLSAEIISNVTSFAGTFERAAKHLKTIKDIFETTANGSLGIDSAIAEARDKRNWLNYRKKSEETGVDNATPDQIVERRRFINSVSMAYENALSQGRIPDLISEISAYEEEFRWID